jgi:hypothetical protein
VELALWLLSFWRQPKLFQVKNPNGFSPAALACMAANVCSAMQNPAQAGCDDASLFCFHATDKPAVLSTTAIVTSQTQAVQPCAHASAWRTTEKPHRAISWPDTCKSLASFASTWRITMAHTPGNSARQTCQCAKTSQPEQADSKTSENA